MGVVEVEIIVVFKAEKTRGGGGLYEVVLGNPC